MVLDYERVSSPCSGDAHVVSVGQAALRAQRGLHQVAQAVFRLNFTYHTRNRPIASSRKDESSEQQGGARQECGFSAGTDGAIKTQY